MHSIQIINGYDKLNEQVQDLLADFIKKNENLGLPERVLVKRDNFGAKYLRVEYGNQWWWVKGYELSIKGNEKIDKETISKIVVQETILPEVIRYKEAPRKETTNKKVIKKIKQENPRISQITMF